MNKRHIFNDDFYKITAILLSKKFLALEIALQNKYRDANVPIPANGFKDELAYKEWLSKAMESVEKPGKDIEGLLVKFSLEPKKEYFRNTLTARLFFNKMPWENSPYSVDPIELTVRNDGTTKELWVKIHPWTKKSDYTKLWKSIKNAQKTLPGYRGKEKFQSTFERNFAVYQLYLKAKKDISISSEKVSIEGKIASYPEYESISKQFRDGDFFDNLRKITSEFNRLLKGVDIL